MKSVNSTARRYWLWVARKEVYLDEEGKEWGGLEPSEVFTESDWWTCDKDTRRGDLVLLYRTAPKSDIGYMIQAESDAYWIGKDSIAAQNNWSYGCDYHVMSKFKSPITYREICNDPFFKDWSARRRNFQGTAFEIPEPYWERLTQMASERDSGTKTLVSELERVVVAQVIRREEQLEEWLIDNLDKLKPFGYDLELYRDDKKAKTGRQLVLLGLGGRIDLLCYDRQRKQYVVIELKNVRARKDIIGQISLYMGWVRKHIAKKERVVGLVISRGSDRKFKSCLEGLGDNIDHLDLKKLGFK